MEDQSKLQVVNDSHIHIGLCSAIDKELTVEDLLYFKKFNNIHKVLIMPSDTNPREGNGQVQVVSNLNDDIYGLHWVTNIIDPIPIDNGIVGAKYHGAYFHRPIDTFMPFLQSLDDKKGILLIHCGRYLEGAIQSNTSYMHALEVAHLYPNIKMILAHMGGTDTTICRKVINHLKRAPYDNIYLDTSGITTPYIIEYAMKQLEDSNRILFGSDAPWCSFNAMYFNVIDAHIDEEDKENIMHHSFERLICST